ncbi:ATP-binding protein [Streptomyces sp. NBC_00057]|uniref:ATP-binding protein n=1 Tax=Streptomyces sp. NBC_00057 TaxID=2975634 RepID=UPI00324ABEBC
MTTPEISPNDTTAQVRIEAHADDNARVYAAGRDQYILHEQAPAPITALRTVPRDVAAFTGRHAEVDQLLAAAQPAEVVAIYTVDGMAGVGKTALVVHAARQLIDRFPDGQLFLRLHAHTPGQRPADPAEALAALLISIGIDPRHIPEGLDARAGLWRDRLTDKRMLLVLDDAADHAQVEPLLPGAEGCLVLVTSRRRIAALDGATPLPLDTLPAEDAALLFTRLAHRTPASAEGSAVADIVRLCGYLPLAIALLAGRFAHHPHWNLAEYAQEFTETQDRLGELVVGDRAVAAAFEVSYRALPPQRKRLFRYLGLHPGPETDVYATAALANIPLAQAHQELEALYDDHLIDSPTTGRYHLHDLLRTYAHTLADQDPADDHDAARGRLLNYYQHTTETADRHLAEAPLPATPSVDAAPAAAPTLATYEQALAWMRIENANLIACTHHVANTAQHLRAIRLTAALASFLYLQGPWDGAITLHQAAVTIARHIGDRLAEAGALLVLSRLRYRTEDYQAAAELAQQALDLYRTLGNHLGQASALRDLGQARGTAGDYQAGAGFAQQALDLYRTLGNRLGEAGALRVLGQVRNMTGDYRAAADFAQQALDLYRTLGNRLGEANVLWDLGWVRNMTGDYWAAVDLEKRALDLYRSLGNRLGEANAQQVLGWVRCATGDYPAAADLLQQATSLYRTLGNQHGEAHALHELSRVRIRTGDLSVAADFAQQALNLYRTLGNHHGEANALQELGRVRTKTGDYPVASDLLQQSLVLFREVGDVQGEAEALNSTGTLLAESTGPEEALSVYGEALHLARQVQSPLDEARALEGAARCHARTGAHHAALADLRQAVSIYDRIGAAEASTATDYLAQLQTDYPEEAAAQESRDQ